MKTTKLVLVLAFMTTLSFIHSLKGQSIAVPYPIQNNTGCDIEVAVEIWAPGCKGCDNGTFLIPSGGSVMVGSPCTNGVLDVHVVLMTVDGQAVTCSQPGGASNSVGDANTCTLSTSSTIISCTYPSGATCTGTWNMLYTAGGTTVW